MAHKSNLVATTIMKYNLLLVVDFPPSVVNDFVTRLFFYIGCK